MEGAKAIPGFRILDKEEKSPDEVVLKIEMIPDADLGGQEMTLKRIGNEWKLGGCEDDVPRAKLLFHIAVGTDAESRLTSLIDVGEGKHEAARVNRHNQVSGQEGLRVRFKAERMWLAWLMVAAVGVAPAGGGRDERPVVAGRDTAAGRARARTWSAG